MTTVTVLRDGVPVEVPREDVFPPPTFAERQTQLLTAIAAHVEALLAVGAPVASGETTLHVALDAGSRADLTAMAATAMGAANSVLPWPESYQRGWITVENIRIPLPTPPDGLLLAAGVGDRYAQIIQRGRDLKDAVITAADEADIADIDIETGWPA